MILFFTVLYYCRSEYSHTVTVVNGMPVDASQLGEPSQALS